MTPPKKTTLACALTAALASTLPHAQQPDTEATTLDVLVVTGTRAINRTAAQSMAPIDVLTPEVLEATGSLELGSALAKVLPSLNFPRPAIADGTDAVRPAQIRGLAPDQVLVLVNGKRRHTTALINLNDSQGRGSSPADLNAIPISAVERIEVLRDGAAAQYGSDAIAGVVNIILKDDSSGGRAALRTGIYSAGDGRQIHGSAHGGITLGESGFLHVSAEAQSSAQTDRARPFIGIPGTSTPPLGQVVQRYGDPDIRQESLSFNGEIGLRDDDLLYSFGIVSNREALSNGFFRPAGDPRNVPEIYPSGFLPKIRNHSADRAMVIGIRGGLGENWTYDLSYSYGYNNLDFNVENSLNRSLGAASPTQFYSGSLQIDQRVANLDMRRSIDVSALDYPLAFSMGAEWREEKFIQQAGEPSSFIGSAGTNTPPGAQVFPGFRPSDAGQHERDNYSLYIDLDAQLTERTSSAIALRHENYSDFGETTSGKLSARHELSDRIALRGTATSGFRAPSLQQQFFQSTATNFIGGVPFDVRTFGVTNPVAIALGAEPLKPEKSNSIGLGVVLRPDDNLSFTIDAYHVDIDDRIVLSENLIGSPVARFLEEREIFGVTGGRYFTNAINTETRGVDVVGSYRWNLPGADLDLTIGYNKTKTDVTEISPNPAALSSVGLNLLRIGRTEEGRITVGSPSDKFFVNGVWTSGNWNITANATRWGKFSALNANSTLDQTFRAKWTIDLVLNYSFESWQLTLGGVNVLDEYPDELAFATSTSGQIPYPRNAPFGFNGAFGYVDIAYRW